MSDDEMEEFNVNEEDLRRAYNPGMGGGRRQTRDRATYGVFANSSDEDDDDGKVRGFGSRYGKKSSNAPIGFVQSSTSSKPKNRQEAEDDDDLDSDEKPDKDDNITDEEDDRVREVGVLFIFKISYY